MPTPEQQLTLNQEAVTAATNMLDTLGYIIQVMASHQNMLVKASNRDVIDQLERLNKAREKLKNILRNKKSVSEKDLKDFTQQLEDINGFMKTLKVYGESGAQFKATGPVKGTASPKGAIAQVGEKDHPGKKSAQEVNAGLEKSFTILSEGLKGIEEHAKKFEKNVAPKQLPFWKKLLNVIIGFAKTCREKFRSLMGIHTISKPTFVKQGNLQQHLQQQLMQERQARGDLKPAGATSTPRTDQPHSSEQRRHSIQDQQPQNNLLSQIQTQRAKMSERKGSPSQSVDQRGSQKVLMPSKGSSPQAPAGAGKVAELKRKFEGEEPMGIKRPRSTK